jgi:pimeloyl-ACP methyl ester carboxylesterase
MTIQQTGRCSLLLLCLLPEGAVAQTRSMAQDSALNNLQHAAGTATAQIGTLGRVRKLGDGPRTMLLIPGLGFGDDIWTEFMERHKTDSTMYAITLPGFGGTAPLPMPAEGTPFANLTWTRSAITAIETMLERERLDRITVVAHWALSSQIALRLALDHPDRVSGVILIGGPLKVYYEGGGTDMRMWTPAQRGQYVEGMGSRWFKTVTKRTWDDNNYMSYDYAINPRRGLFLWREAQSPSLPVWIRYLLEFYSIDLSVELQNLKVPVLVVQPAFDDPAFYVEPDRNYMRNLCIDSWRGAAAMSRQLEFVTIPQSRLFVMHDQPDVLDQVMSDFLKRSTRALTKVRGQRQGQRGEGKRRE